ncbi:hypothetical protein HZC09_01130 [Candidatus Micrarchaeota archaeon]|nr:hypothetical protein [Candidatus Micrarchaeota archaeon]
MELAIKVKEENLSEQSINELLQKHAENFCWLAVYDFDEEPWKVEHFGERLKTLCYKNTKELKQEILETEKQYLHNHEEFEKVLKKIKDPTLKNLALTGHAFAYLKDARDDYRREGNYLAEPLFAETARRAGLTQKEAIQLTSREIINFLRTGHVDRARVRERLNGFTVTMQCSRLHVYSGEEAKQKAEEQLQRTSSEKRGVVKGIPGALGTARGPACIIRHKLLLHKVKPGDILISNTTMPDYVPAMKKAKAVVTDEGGITCHAAIVCRELKIPCVVGTQTATKEFEDGDLVEVDAEHGIVKKINVPKKKTRNTMKELAKRSFKASKTAGELCKEAEEDFW